MTGYREQRWAPEGAKVRNPAFDVTPAGLITGIICERGVVLSPNRESIRLLLG
jgi:methylthioribose-1-phosphate isomerase